MKRSNQKFILAEICAWAREGLIDAALREKLESRYAVIGTDSEAVWRSVILASVGALLVGLGVIALLAANWDALSRSARALIALTPLSLSVAAWTWAAMRGKTARTFMEPLGVFWVLSVGAGLALVSQTYQTSFNVDAFALVWTLLLLPVLYGTLALAPAVGYFAGLFVWAYLSAEQEANSQAYWLLMPLAAPAQAMMRRESQGGVRVTVTVWCGALLATAALGITLEKMLPGLWMVVYAGAFAALLAGGALSEHGGARMAVWQMPMRTLGGVGTAGLLYLLTFRWPWREIGWRHWHWERVDAAWQTVFDYTLAGGLPLLAGGLLIVVWVRTRRAGGPAPLTMALWGLSPTIVAGLYAWCAQSKGDTAQVPALVVTGWLAFLSLAALAAGLRQRSIRLVNGSVLTLLALIVGKFFTEEFSFTVRGVVFILCGVLFFVANALAARKLRGAVG